MERGEGKGRRGRESGRRRCLGVCGSDREKGTGSQFWEKRKREEREMGLGSTNRPRPGTLARIEAPSCSHC